MRLAPRERREEHYDMVARTLLSFAALSLLFTSLCDAGLSLGSPFSESMVLQRGVSVPVWGTADANTLVTVRFGAQAKQVQSGADGKFVVALDPLDASKTPRVLIVTSGADEVSISDVLVGEVWIASGQSNMEWPVSQSDDPARDQLEATNATIRIFKAPHLTASSPQSSVPGAWTVASPSTVGSFTAIGYSFAQGLSKTLDVPVGVLDLSWGGSRIEPWIPREGFATLREWDRKIEAMDRSQKTWRELDGSTIAQLLNRAESHYTRQKEDFFAATLGTERGSTEGFYKPEYNDAAWATCTLPNMFGSIDPSLAAFDGTVWFRRTFTIPAAMANTSLRFELPAIDDSDVAYVDEMRLGDTAGDWEKPRAYRLASGLSAGSHSISICVIDASGNGGFAKDQPMRIVREDDATQTLSLTGAWKWEKGGNVPRIAYPDRFDPLKEPNVKFESPMAMYNAMIAPCVPYAVQGAIWYQGESNAGEHAEYALLLKALVDGWRTVWANPNLAFGNVQLAGFMAAAPTEPVQPGWGSIRAAQEAGVDAINREDRGAAGLVTAIDIGSSGDIHPKNKREVGNRLSHWALEQVYHASTGGWAGPLFTSASRVGPSVTLHFDHASGLTTRGGGAPSGFALAGDDGVFVWADAVIEGDTVIVSSSTIANPTQVAYAWQNFPETSNIVNAEALPMYPFRSALKP